MNLGKFRELTKEIPDDVDLIIDAKANPFGNCWSVLTIEATELASFGKLYPALKMSEQNPEWAKEDSDLQLFIDPENGQWLRSLINKKSDALSTSPTSPVVALRNLLKDDFDDVEFEFEFRKTDDLNGFQFLNIYYQECEIGIEWKSNVGFALLISNKDLDDLYSLYSSTEDTEWYESIEAVYHRVASVLIFLKTGLPISQCHDIVKIVYKIKKQWYNICVEKNQKK
jgi:hypothetical protein